MGKVIIVIGYIYIMLFTELCYSRTDDLTISLTGKDAIQIAKNRKIRKHHFNIEVNGYKVNCSGEKLILWGYPLRFNESSPADNSYVLYDIVNDSIISNGLMGHGIFDVEFLKDNKRAFLESGEGYFLYLKTGSLTKVDNGIINDLNNLFQKCKRPIGWTYNRFPD
jgi:hypothetical protein